MVSSVRRISKGGDKKEIRLMVGYEEGNEVEEEVVEVEVQVEECQLLGLVL